MTSKTFQGIFNRRRLMKNSVESLLFLFAATLGGILSLTISNFRPKSTDLILLGLIVFILAISLIIFWEWYERPKRANKNFLDLNTHSNTKEILEELKDIKEILRRKLDHRFVGALPHPDKKK